MPTETECRRVHDIVIASLPQSDLELIDVFLQQNQFRSR